jgi:diguanylate cyclase (GGDEF)-like protein/PAS domain S-box-containing protein
MFLSNPLSYLSDVFSASMVMEGLALVFAGALICRATRNRRIWTAPAAPHRVRDTCFRGLIESNPIPMWVFHRESLRLLTVNEAALTEFGYTRSQFRAMTFAELCPQEDRGTLAQLAEETRRRGPNRVLRHRRSDGSVMQAAVHASEIMDGTQSVVLVAAIDMSAQAAAEADLRKARAFLDTIFDAVPVSVFVKELRSGRYVLVNQAAERFTGLDREAIIGRRPEDLEPGAEAMAARARDLALLRAGARVAVSEYDHRTRCGEVRRVSVKRVVVSDGDGEPTFMVAVVDDQTDLIAARQRIAYLDRHDSLTGLRNRPAFLDDFGDLLRTAAAQSRQVMLVSIDICNFAEVNDCAGSLAGDEILKAVAACLSADEDLALVGRVGGDEFMVALTSTARAASDFAHRLNDVVRRCGAAFQEGIVLGVDAGIAIFPADGTDPVILMANAEAAQHRAKARAAQYVCFFEAAVDQRLRDQRKLHRDLDGAIRQGAFVPFYQPQARIDGTVYGVEALLRWNHPERGLVLPGDFIAAAEESGQIIEIGEMMLRQVCLEAAQWDQPLDVAVNLSPVQFEQADLAGMVADILAETGLPARRLEIEITESTLIGDNRRALRMLGALKAMGVRIAMDDFGTGYSSLAYLQSFPFDRIKIDRQFICGLETSPQSAAIVKAVIGLGRGLGLPVLAEGVERREQMRMLRMLGCDEVQGFLIGRPQRTLPAVDRLRPAPVPQMPQRAAG